MPVPPGPVDVEPQGKYPPAGACYGHKAVLQSEFITVRVSNVESLAIIHFITVMGFPPMLAIKSSPRRRYRPVSRGPPSGASHILAALTKSSPPCIGSVGQQPSGFRVPLILNHRMHGQACEMLVLWTEPFYRCHVHAIKEGIPTASNR